VAAWDYYSTLGLTIEASTRDIKTAYRKLAMQHHPDRNRGNPESEERLKEINEAYQILGDEDKRRQYNLQHRQPFESHVFYNEGMDKGFVNLFRKFPQSGANRKRPGICRRGGLGRRGCGRSKR